MKTSAALVVCAALACAGCSSEAEPSGDKTDAKATKTSAVSSKDEDGGGEEEGGSGGSSAGSGSKAGSASAASPAGNQPAPESAPPPEVAPPPPEDPAIPGQPPAALPDDPAPAVTPQPPATRAVFRYKSGSDHLWTLGANETHPGFTYEGPAFTLLAERLGDARALFECTDGTRFFLSIELDCEGATKTIELGYLLAGERPATTPMTRCDKNEVKLSTIDLSECTAASLPIIGPQGYAPVQGFLWP